MRADVVSRWVVIATQLITMQGGLPLGRETSKDAATSSRPQGRSHYRLESYKTRPPVAKKSVIASSNSPSCVAPCTRLSILAPGFSKSAHTLTHTTRSARSSSTTTCSKHCRDEGLSIFKNDFAEVLPALVNIFHKLQ
ncbi:hypothetical protein JTE90_028465 [Oedothorax gibbosus]|uniref:Secreted protein n=1 Tax=Oedothorax gibbosus TaxID=931172 RepID=A0AAV6VI05_9ARAC|nr:hypothetical protein JTE90_028465 [Oedothorax gibbosus]